MVWITKKDPPKKPIHRSLKHLGVKIIDLRLFSLFIQTWHGPDKECRNKTETSSIEKRQAWVLIKARGKGGLDPFSKGYQRS
jgi:hypothetical protein